ncbi:MAG: cobalamin-dependent protein [Candidatus Riflebacteria bacterium]|nr:cobalamin-dependent protein [Candidatus Riflebacteria bacterium]
MPGRPRTLLVFSTPIKSDSFFGYLLPPLGLERIAANIADIADVCIMDLRFEKDNWLERAVEFNPDFIGINVKTTLYSTTSYHTADRLRAAIPHAMVVLGGLHASSVPEEAIEHGHAVIVGDGEIPFREIVEGKDHASIAGIVFKPKHGKLVKNPPVRPGIELDKLPPPARHLRNPRYKYSASGLIPMDLLETSRGCDLFCPFCSPAEIHKGKWRAHSPEYVLAEVKRIHALGAKYVMLTDDNFAVDLDRAKAISELIIESKLKMAFFCFLRPFVGRMDVKQAMVNAGFVMLSYGAESPNAEQLKRFGKGFSDPENFIKTVNDEWRAAGARYIGNSFVFGDPCEAGTDIQNLGDYARYLDPTYIEPLYSQPYPGTRYRSDIDKKGLLMPHNWDRFTEGRMISRHPQLSENELRNARADLWTNFFSPRKIVGAFRVPLYLHHVVGIPARTILKYMKSCDYCMFGCVLEDKFYFHLRRKMVRKYLSELINNFSEFERDMTSLVDEFTDMAGIGPLKSFIGTRSISLEIVEKAKSLTRFRVDFENGKIAKVMAGSDQKKGDIEISMRLEDAVELVCAKDFAKFAALARTALYNVFLMVKI